jgi:3-oxoacyl-[acyl-carrier-protein] synthase III
MPEKFTESRLRDIVEKSLRAAIGPDAPLPADDEGWVRVGALDSMALVDVLLSIGRAAGLPDFLDRVVGGLPSSTKSVLEALRSVSAQVQEPLEVEGQEPVGALASLAGVTGWGAALGSVRVEVATLEREYSFSAGRLAEGAGIESVVRASPEEDEVSLGFSACQAALDTPEFDVDGVDWLVATSETFCGFPSLGSSLHSRLLARDTCGVLDVGGGCTGLVSGLFVANSLISTGVAGRVLVATADVHSRHLSAGRVAGEFGGLFGDGASAFVISRFNGSPGFQPYRLGDFQFGCAGAFSALLSVRLSAEAELAVEFRGEALARAAVSRLESILADLELRTGFDRTTASGFATQQPNPRLLELLARQAALPLDKFPPVSKTCGNLGSSTCGVALARILDAHGRKPADQRGPIFLAAVGPGMVWAGGILC